MGQVIPRQHPAVVLKSHYKAVRALLAAALIAIVALSAAVVIVANDDDVSVSPQAHAQTQQNLPAGTRFDGGPDEGTRGIQAAQPAPGTRFDGGPDEGTRGIQAASDEGLKARAGGPRYIPMGPGSR